MARPGSKSSAPPAPAEAAGHSDADLEETVVDWRQQLAAPAAPGEIEHTLSWAPDPSVDAFDAAAAASATLGSDTGPGAMLRAAPARAAMLTIPPSSFSPAPDLKKAPAATLLAGEAHFRARPPDGWSPLPSDPSSAAAGARRAAPPAPLPDRGGTPVHQAAHPAAAAAPTDDADQPTLSAPDPDSLLEALGRRRSFGLPLAFMTPRAAKAATAATPLVAAVTRALSSAFHDLELVHADEERIVFSGLDLALRRRVSVHALAPGLARDAQLAAQFVREAQSFAGLSHRTLLRLHRVAAEPVPHFVAEPLPGQLLCTVMTGDPIALHEVLATGAHVTEALDHLHQRGMTHGDLRPSRVVGGLHGEVRLCPPIFPHATVESLAALGLACAERRAYRAPEVAGGAVADYRGDIHAAGMLLHHMLTGAPPPPRHAEEDDAEAFRYRAAVPDALSTLIRRCVQTDPARRYQDCGIARQMLETLSREHGARERVVLACLPSLAKTVRQTLQPLAGLLAGAHAISAEQLARDVTTPAWRDPIRQRLLGPDGGLAAIGVLIERGQGLRRWTQEAALFAMTERLGRMALELAGLVTLIESGGPRHPSVADRARTELLRLAGDIEAFEQIVQAEVASRLVDFAAAVKEAAGTQHDALPVDARRVLPALRGLFAEPASVRGRIVGALASALAAASTAGARCVTVNGAYEDGFKRILITVTDDGRTVPAAVVRPPLAIVPRLTRPAAAGDSSAPRDLERAYDAIEALGGRVMLTNRTGSAGVELRIELPSNLC